MKSVLIFLVAILGGPVADAQPAESIRSPNVSANSLILYRNSSDGNDAPDTVRNGLDLQETEVAFYADVDPYSRLNILLSVHPEYTFELAAPADPASGERAQSWLIEPEELFAELTHIPLTTVRFGKFKAALGKTNLLHTHALPFIEPPIANSVLLGEEGLNDVGLSAAVLLPLPWFSEVTAQALRGEGEIEYFNSGTPNDGVLVAHWKNLWDLSEALTFELGGSFANGMNSADRPTSFIGADFTFKWRPLEGGRYRSWIFAGEYLERTLGQAEADEERSRGFNVWGRYQFAERWSALARYEQIAIEGSDPAAAESLANETTQKYTAGLVFHATEFSSYRLELSQRTGPHSGGHAHGPAVPGEHGDENVHALLLQANFTIGAHPAHTY